MEKECIIYHENLEDYLDKLEEIGMVYQKSINLENIPYEIGIFKYSDDQAINKAKSLDVMIEENKDIISSLGEIEQQ